MFQILVILTTATAVGSSAAPLPASKYFVELA
jgi:hypothetical protein